MAVQNMQKRYRAVPRLDYEPGYTEDLAFRLSPDSEDVLADILGLDQLDRKECLVEVRRWLSMYPDMVKTHDKAPRPAHTLAFLRPLITQARALREGLLYIEQPVWWDFMVRGFRFDKDSHELGERLDDFLCVAEDIEKELNKQESRHGRPRIALNYLISKLTHIFDRYAFLEHENDRAGLLAEFVRVALSAARIPHPRLASSGGDTRVSRSRLRRHLQRRASPRAPRN